MVPKLIIIHHMRCIVKNIERIIVEVIWNQEEAAT